ncbi:RICIN domain-containing protein [Streptomyces sp. NBC_00879]|nr:RICIN domain-containing protein [Streptomyces sp. NBC_00879]
MLELSQLNARLRSVLPGGVLLWGAAAYLTARGPGTSVTAAFGASPGSPPVDGHSGLLAKAKASPLGTGATAAATAIAIVIAIGWLVLPPDGEGGEVEPPAASLSAAASSASVEPSVSRKPSKGTSSRTPRPRPTPSPSASSSASPTYAPSPTDVPAPEWTPEADARTRLRVVSTGNCMEIPGGSPAELVQPREAVCDGGAAQLWDLVFPSEGDGALAQLRNAATGLCLTSSGTLDDESPVEQRACEPTDTRQLWLVCEEAEEGVHFIDQAGEMYLGLNDWTQAEAAHSDTIGTSYPYDPPSFSFLLDDSLV